MPVLEYPHPELTEGQVRLRQWTLEDIPFVTASCQDPEVSRYSPVIPRPYTEADAISWFETHEPTRISGESLQFAVVHAMTGQRLGTVGIHGVSWTLASCDIGYWLATSARGHGYMTSAVKALLRWCFGELKIERVQLTHDPDNTASEGVAARSRFTREGYMRSHMHVAHSGERRDSVLWSILPGEVPGSDPR